MRLKSFALLAICTMLLAACSPKSASDAPSPVVWRLDNIGTIGGNKVAIIGSAPAVVDGTLRFDGKSQGVLLPVFPVAGWKAYTVEMEIFPEAGGEFEQRFFHGATSEGPRMMIELRSNPNGSWFLDTHIRDAADNRGTLIDEKKTHASGRWYTVKLVYDGETMSHYVDGVKQGEVKAKVAPMPEGPVSLGVRQNRVCWFKGAIREVRFWNEARR